MPRDDDVAASAQIDDKSMLYILYICISTIYMYRQNKKRNSKFELLVQIFHTIHDTNAFNAQRNFGRHIVIVPSIRWSVRPYVPLRVWCIYPIF